MRQDHKKQTARTNRLLLFLEYENAVSSPPAEFKALTATLGYKNIPSVSFRVRQPHAGYFLGEGQLRQLKTFVTEHRIKQVIVNMDLSGGNHRNLTNELNVELLDRTGVILKIFSQHARSYQSKLQVELAQLHYQSTHLVRGWTHLERQRGAIGQRGGPGEKQLETDRRLLRRRIGTLNTKLKKIRKQRQLGQRTRKKSTRPLMALVGYTNAGKSSLFNQMTRADAVASPKLFATLDPLIRKMRADMGNFLVTDTVGFIDNLSPMLLESFAATLEEIAHADVILHVADVTDPDIREKEKTVTEMLHYLNADSIPCLKVYNKIDASTEPTDTRVLYDFYGTPVSARISASTGTGVRTLATLAQDLLIQHDTHQETILQNARKNHPREGVSLREEWL